MKEIDILNQRLIQECNTKIVFSKNAQNDYKAFAKGKRINILKLLAKQAKQGALFPPDGTATRCRSELHEFAKIKNLAMNIRIIYRPKKTDIIEMQVIAIGPRDELEAYNIAKERLQKFYREFGN